VLDMPLTLEVEGDVYAEFDAGGHILALYRRDFMAGTIGTTGKPADADAQDRVALSFDVDDVDEAYRTLTARGVVFVVGPTDRAEWVLRTAHFRDPDGNLIEINHSLYHGE
jgi:catechol 2,3-dioxygenase-like lactoylglutathione lyase family enzyme